MNNFTSLKVIDIFRPIFTMFDVDYPVMRRILQVKLAMDARRVSTIFSDSGKKPKGNQFLKSLLIYAFFGLMLIFFLIGDAYMLQMSIAFGVMMFLLMTAMIADFSSVLLDIRDAVIIGTKPVNQRTINAAKLIHIIVYMTMLTGAFAGLPLIVSLFIQGPIFALVFLLDILFLVMFIIALTALIYLVVLRVFNGEKLKNMINYIQIILAIGVFAGYQLIIRIFDFNVLDIAYQFEWWHGLIPPVWFAAPFELLINRNYSVSIIVLASLAVIIPVLSIILYYLLMPVFERDLQKLLQSSSNKKKHHLIMKFWQYIICRGSLQRIYFRFAYRIVSEEREFKLKVYPSLGMGVIFPFVFLLNDVSNRGYEGMTQGSAYFTIYFLHIIIGPMVYMMQYSSQYKGAWIYRMVEVATPGLMFSAVLKVFITKYYVPAFLLVGGAYYYIFERFSLADAGIVFLSAVLQILIVYKTAVSELYPFSAPFESLKEGGYTAKTFLMMFMTLPFPFVHFLLSNLPYGKLVYGILLLIIVAVIWKKLFSDSLTKQSLKKVS